MSVLFSELLCVGQVWGLRQVEVVAVVERLKPTCLRRLIEYEDVRSFGIALRASIFVPALLAVVNTGTVAVSGGSDRGFAG